MANKMRRLLAVLIALTFCIGLAMPAMAAETDAAPESEPAAVQQTVSQVVTPDVTPAAVEISVAAPEREPAAAQQTVSQADAPDAAPAAVETSVVTSEPSAAAPGGGNPGGGGQPGGGDSSSTDENTAVDHIDINVTATGTVIIDGVEQQVTVGVTKDDADNVTITNEGAEGSTDFTVSGDVSTSSDANGESQIRIEGSFDIGTQENPTEYTVELVKTTTVGEGDDAQEVTVTLSTTTDYWDPNNLCPMLWNNGNANSTWVDGGFVSGSGIDLRLTASGEAEGGEEQVTTGQITIQKTVVGIESGLEEDTVFYFDVQDESGNTVYSNMGVTVGAGQTTGILIVENVALGTYVVIELVEETGVEGYNLSAVLYSDGSRDEDGNLIFTETTQTIVVSEDHLEGWVGVQNIYDDLDLVDDEDSKPTEPPATEPPATEPPATEPPATEPPATEPPATEPPATEPPATEPPETEPPATEPPATEPPATEPPATEPPETEPPETDVPTGQSDDGPGTPEETDPPATKPNIPQYQSEDDGIIDADVPKAVVPRTGDISLIWTLLSGLSAGGLVVLNRKKED